MTTYGLTDAGFVDKSLEVIKAEIESDQRAEIAAGLNQQATSVLGQLNGIYAAKLGELWELAAAVYAAADPDEANAAALDNVCALCPGLIRRPASKSTVTATVNVDDGTYPIGSLIAHVSGDETARFVNTEEVVESGGGGNHDVDFEAETAGATQVLSGTLTEIAEPVSGWNSVTNAADGTTGEDTEKDSDFRLRRELEIRLAGGSHIDAIRADVLEVDGVQACVVFENDTDEVVDGMDPHSVHVVIWDGSGEDADDDEVAEAIYNTKSAGIATNGTEGGFVTDSMGVVHTLKFDRATEKTLYVEVDVDVDDDTYAGDAAVQAAVAALVASYSIGDDVIVSRIVAAVFEVTGVEDVTEVRVGWSASPSGTVNLTVANDEIAVLQSTVVDSS